MTETFLTLLVQYSFWIGFSAMAAGALYFALERQSLAVEYQMVATLSAALTAIAAINYWTMKDFGLSLDAEGQLSFPTHFRYIDWLLTTPMLLAIIPILLNMERGVGALMAKLLIADVIMVVTGYVGETSINAGLFPTVVGWAFYAAGVLAFAYIVFVLYGAMTSAQSQLPPERARAIGRLKLFVTFGWLIYPAGFFFTLVGDGATPALIRELVYNFADIINKVGFCMVAVAAAKAASYVRVGSPRAAPAE
ncbi:MAG: bacteriorhodopsin [Oceanicaulis sp.]